jgi:phosphoglycolate phosphatase
MGLQSAAVLGDSMNLIIFDCDGTIVDSQHIIVAAMDHAFTTHGLTPLPRARTLAIVGLSLNQAIGRLLPHSDAGFVEQVAQSYKAAFGELRRDPAHLEPAYPGAIETIRTLSARPDTVLGIATGKSKRGVAAIFDRFDLHPHFVTIQTADGHPSKPHPSMIATAIQETGATAASTVMIGDTTFDIEMAKNADVAGIGVAWGYHPVAQLQLAGAHAIARDYTDLVPTIDRILSPELQP